MEIETDKVTVEIDAPASGILAGIRAQPGDSIPVGQTIAWIVDPGDPVPDQVAPLQSGKGRWTIGGRQTVRRHPAP